MTPRSALLVGMLATGLLGCATNPVLYPNYTLENQGRAAADAAIADCENRARQYEASDSSRVLDTAGSTAAGAGTGAATGAAGGAIRGGAGTGAAIGAATGATFSFMRSLFRKRGPDPIRKNFVERCLAESGYVVVGWR